MNNKKNKRNRKLQKSLTENCCSCKYICIILCYSNGVFCISFAQRNYSCSNTLLIHGTIWQLLVKSSKRERFLFLLYSSPSHLVHMQVFTQNSKQYPAKNKTTNITATKFYSAAIYHVQDEAIIVSDITLVKILTLSVPHTNFFSLTPSQIPFPLPHSISFSVLVSQFHIVIDFSLFLVTALSDTTESLFKWAKYANGQNTNYWCFFFRRKSQPTTVSTLASLVLKLTGKYWLKRIMELS